MEDANIFRELDQHQILIWCWSIAKEAGVDIDQLSAKISQCQKTFEYDYEDWYELHYPDGSGLEITCDNGRYFFL